MIWPRFFLLVLISGIAGFGLSLLLRDALGWPLWSVFVIGAVIGWVLGALFPSIRRVQR